MHVFMQNLYETRWFYSSIKFALSLNCHETKISVSIGKFQNLGLHFAAEGVQENKLPALALESLPGIFQWEVEIMKR